ncbi:MAG: hypothetical protein ACD_75C00621G0002 [uncultured bacterium]|nr:MAG: hypothetical protein ACD_75C00621G0002 [uncultured bacterium]
MLAHGGNQHLCRKLQKFFVKNPAHPEWHLDQIGHGIDQPFIDGYSPILQLLGFRDRPFNLRNHLRSSFDRVDHDVMITQLLLVMGTIPNNNRPLIEESVADTGIRRFDTFVTEMEYLLSEECNQPLNGSGKRLTIVPPSHRFGKGQLKDQAVQNSGQQGSGICPLNLANQHHVFALRRLDRPKITHCGTFGPGKTFQGAGGLALPVECGLFRRSEQFLYSISLFFFDIVDDESEPARRSHDFDDAVVEFQFSCLCGKPILKLSKRRLKKPRRNLFHSDFK